MSDVLFGALVSGGVSIIVATIQHSKSMAVLEERITSLTKSVEKHNSVIERTYDLETKVAVIEEKLKG